nr:flavodoxin [Bacteroidota bacterium]
MEKVGIFYGSSTGNTEKIAEKIKLQIGEENVETINVYDATEEDIKRFRNLIFGTSTWGIGDIQEDWEEFIEAFENIDLKNKKVALFGLGDQEVYGDSFAEGVAGLYRHFKDKADLVGQWPNEGYVFESSDALVDGQFVGLIIDEDNQRKMSDDRIKKWVSILQKEFI